MDATMKWFIACIIIIFFGLGLLIGMHSGLTFYLVDSKIEEWHRANLLILYDIKIQEE